MTRAPRTRGSHGEHAAGEAVQLAEQCAAAAVPTRLLHSSTPCYVCGCRRLAACKACNAVPPLSPVPAPARSDCPSPCPTTPPRPTRQAPGPRPPDRPPPLQLRAHPRAPVRVVHHPTLPALRGYQLGPCRRCCCRCHCCRHTLCRLWVLGAGRGCWVLGGMRFN